MAFEVVQVPVWRDNYAYVLLAEDGTAAVVDSPEAGPVLDVIRARGARLTHLLNTHHHGDHVGANRELCAAFPALEVFAGRYDRDAGRIPGQTRALGDGDVFEWGGEACTVRELPGHTLGHVAYLFDGRAFVGDTLFVAGCGRLFEGSAEQMDHSLCEVLGALPDSTRLYCAHEYTEANLRFARHVDPDNEALAAWAEQVRELRAAGRPTVPSRLGDERAINPFLRGDEPALRAAAGLPASAPRHEVFGALRRMKDEFRG